MKKVLIISYYWPPSGGAGVQRWIRFVNHLRSFGWEPVLYVPKDAKYAVFDEKLLDVIPKDIETLKCKIREPNNIMQNLAFWKKNKSKVSAQTQEQPGKTGSLKHRLLWYIRGNYFIPDARLLWIKPSIKFLQKRLEKGDIDMIVSTGPPHSLHMIAKGLKKYHDIPWVADFRDPWVSMDYLQQMSLTERAWKKHRDMEESVVKSADSVVVIGKTMYNEFKENHQIESVIIHNGYDSGLADTPEFPLDKKFTLVHIGTFSSNRNCDDLWETLLEITKENEEFAKHLEIKLIGNVAPDIMHSIERLKLKPYLNKIDYVPFAETQKFLFGAQILLLPINRVPNAEFVLTGKLFEYLKSKRPIMLLGPSHGDAAHIINNCQAGDICDFDDKSQIKTKLLARFRLFLEGNNYIESVNVDQYSAYELTRKLSGVFNDLCSNDQGKQEF